MPQITETSRAGRDIAFTTSDDFVGYETSYYAVKERNGGGVRIVFMSAWVTENGKTTRRPRPIVPILTCQIPPGLCGSFTPSESVRPITTPQLLLQAIQRSWID